LKLKIQVETKFEWPKYDSTEKFVKFCPNKKNNKNDYDLGQYKESIYPYIPRQIMNEVELISPDPPVWLVGRVKWLMEFKSVREYSKLCSDLLMDV
jgi:hypothetical protein